MPTVRIWVYDGVLASGVFAPIDVFMAANRYAARGLADRAAAAEPLAWRVESLDGGPVRAASGQAIAVDGRIDSRGRADAILVTAPFVDDMDAFMARRDQVRALSGLLRRRHASGALIAAYCTGAYLLAEAGLLDGKVATTHWARRADFARRYPGVALRADQILTEHDRILCSGAVTSFLDLAVRLLDRLAGPQLAEVTAKALLIDAHRVSQAAYAIRLQEHGHADPLVARAERLMEAALAEPVRLGDLAARLAVSERTLHRRFRQATGEAPLAWLQGLRIAVAKRLLEASDLSFEAVGERVGYSDPSAFRLVFKRHTGLTPRDYRRRFARQPAEAVAGAAARHEA